MRALLGLLLLLASCDRLFGLATVAAPDSTTPLAGWVDVALGQYSTCGIRDDGTLWCWGSNANGELGFALTTFEIETPTQVGTDTTWSEVRSSDFSKCALRTDGSLWCWGYNVNGQLGIGTMVSASAPTQVDGVWRDVELSPTHTCGIRDDGTLWCWGANRVGQLGDGTTTPRLEPGAVATALTWKTVSTGHEHTCAIATDDTLWCWGENLSGELGDGTTTNSRTPIQIGNERWQQVTAGISFTCGRTMADRLRCWGYEGFGQLGRDATIVPAPVGSDDDDWTDIHNSLRTTCATKRDGTAWCWGGNALGQLGIENEFVHNQDPLAVTIPGVESQWTKIRAGELHVCVIDAERSLWCRGAAGRGQLGTGSSSKRVPTGLPSSWTQVVAGADTTCATDAFRHLHCAGEASSRQIGDGRTIARKSFIRVIASAQDKIAGGSGHTCAIEAGTGTLRCWGANAYGQLGDGTFEPRQSHVQVAGAWVSVDASEHTCAVSSTTVSCWGRNTSGQLGDGTMQNRPTPTPVNLVVGGAAIDIAVGGEHTCARTTAGANTYCWGRNTEGQLGNGTVADSLAPKPVSGGAVFRDLYAGRAFTCGIAQTTDLLSCWGRNTQGELGLGDNANRTDATQVGSATWRSLGLGNNHACGIQIGGTLWCWGGNARGQLGDGTHVGRNAPGQVGVDTDWQRVTAGDAHTCARKTNGSVWCWGSNDAGEIPDGTSWRLQLAPVPDP